MVAPVESVENDQENDTTILRLMTRELPTQTTTSSLSIFALILKFC